MRTGPESMIILIRAKTRLFRLIGMDKGDFSKEGREQGRRSDNANGKGIWQGFETTLQPLSGLLRAYSAIFFIDKPIVGMVFLLATFVYPNVGVSGLLAGCCGMIAGRLLRFSNLDNGLHIYNSILVGLSLGAAYQINQYLCIVIALGSILAVLVSTWLNDYLWRLDHLSPLSLPFVVVALNSAFAAQSFTTLQRYLAPMAPVHNFLPQWLADFLTALGSAFFSPHPLTGLLILIPLLWCSRYLVLLGALGYLVGQSLYEFLIGGPHPQLGHWIGFNFILTCMAVGGVFTIPSLSGLLLALVAAALAALITAATQNIMLVYGLPVMALPFIITTFSVLLALRKRNTLKSPRLILENPALPELSLERAQLAKSRGIDPASLALQPPFIGTWQLYQGFNGAHTHQGPWRYALDFYREENGRSFCRQGLVLEDFYCYGLPILAPLGGVVESCRNNLPDNPPGEVNVTDNWGNYIMLLTPCGHYVVLAHLKQFSLQVMVGDAIIMGQMLGQCGNSGRSPQPHLHLHVQHGHLLGSATAPFHLTGVLSVNPSAYRLRYNPVVGESVSAASPDNRLKKALHLAVGRQLLFRYCLSNGDWKLARWRVELSLLGEFRLVTEKKARVAFVESDNLLAFYDRHGPSDPLLDAFILAMGLTPYHQPVSGAAPITWSDRPPLRLFPKTRLQKIAALFRYPLGGAIVSDYQRQWDGSTNLWRQKAVHRLHGLPGRSWKISTEAELMTENGCVTFKLHQGRKVWIQAQLVGTGLSCDQGIPGWRQPLDSIHIGKGYVT